MLPYRRDTLRRYRDINSRLWEQYSLGALSSEYVALERFRKLLADSGLEPRRARALARAYLDDLSRRGDVLPGGRRALLRLRRRYALAAVTNGFDRVQRARLAAAGLTASFDAIVTSEGCGYAKPDPRIVREALRAIGVPRHEALYVGDDLRTDRGAALAAGVPFVWLKGDKAAPRGRLPRRSVRSLLELADRLLSRGPGRGATL